MSGGTALQALVVGLSLGAVYGLVGLGFSLVWSLTRVLAFAHGDVVIGAVLLAVLAAVGSTPVAIAPGVGRSTSLVVLTLLIGVVLSVLVYLVTVRPFLDRTHLGEDVMGWVAGGVTAGLVIRTAVGVALPAAAYAVPDALHLDALTATGTIALPGGASMPARALPVLGIAAVVAVLTDRFLAVSRSGRGVRAVADDSDAAALCGVPVERVVLLAFALAGLLAAIAALLVAPVGTVSVDRGALLGLYGAAAAVLGGLGSLRGALVGGLVVGLVQEYAAVLPHLGAAWSQLAPLALLVTALAVWPEGVRARRTVAVE